MQKKVRAYGRLIFLCLVLYSQNALSIPQSKEVKIYRKISYVLPAFRATWVGGVFAIGQFQLYVANEIKIISENQRSFFSTAVLPGLAIAYLYAEITQQLEWNEKKGKPILIFDKEGFTYEQSQGLFKERKDVRCLWKNVVSHWGVAGESGESLYWKYHVRGLKDIITINVFELEIPEEMLGQVESLRQGCIKALDCSDEI